MHWSPLASVGHVIFHQLPFNWHFAMGIGAEYYLAATALQMRLEKKMSSIQSFFCFALFLQHLFYNVAIPCLVICQSWKKLLWPVATLFLSNTDFSTVFRLLVFASTRFASLNSRPVHNNTIWLTKGSICIKTKTKIYCILKFLSPHERYDFKLCEKLITFTFLISPVHSHPLLGHLTWQDKIFLSVALSGNISWKKMRY